MKISKKVIERMNEFYAAFIMYAAVGAGCVLLQPQWPHLKQTLESLISIDLLWIAAGFTAVAFALKLMVAFMARTRKIRLSRIGSAVSNILIKAAMGSYGLLAGVIFGFAASALVLSNVETDKMANVLAISIGVTFLACSTFVPLSEVEKSDLAEGEGLLFGIISVFMIGIAILVAISNEDIAVAISSVLYVGMFIWLVILNTRSRRDVSVDLVISSSGVNATALPDGSYRVNAAFDLRSLPTPRQE